MEKNSPLKSFVLQPKVSCKNTPVFEKRKLMMYKFSTNEGLCFLNFLGVGSILFSASAFEIEKRGTGRHATGHQFKLLVFLLFINF